MSQEAYVSSEALRSLIDGFQECASEIAALRGEVKAHIDECIAEATDIVNRLREIEATAEERYDRCEAACSSCHSRQRYDEESGGYRPSCASEERRMEKAEREYRKARDVRESAESRLKDMEREVGYYTQPTGGDGIMNSITAEYVPEATARLMRMQDVVVRYENLAITGIDTGGIDSQAPVLDAPQSKALGFGKGARRVQEKMDRRKALFGSYCPKCKCCPCECDRINELLMLRTRNYGR